MYRSASPDPPEIAHETDSAFEGMVMVKKAALPTAIARFVLGTPLCRTLNGNSSIGA